MVKIKYIGPNSKVIAGKRLLSGETIEVNEKVVDTLRSDPDIEVWGELPKAEEPVSQVAETPEENEAPTEAPASQVPDMPQPIKRTRGKKK